MPTGAHGTLLPIHTTKIGAGDKERAYVVRQNFFLKIVLAVVLTIAGLAGILCRTTYEIHVQRRDSIQDSRDHRDEEHASHLRVIRLSTLLQRRLKDEVHDMKVLTQYRAWLLRVVGDYQAQVQGEVEANCTGAQPQQVNSTQPQQQVNSTQQQQQVNSTQPQPELVKEQLQQMGLQFDQHVDFLLKRLWDDLVEEGKIAQTQLHNITAAIMSELRQDASEASDFEQLLRDNGEQVEEDEEGEGDEHSSLGIALEAFHVTLRSNESVVHVSNATIVEWQQKYDTTMHTLSDDEEEADMERLNTQIQALLFKAGVPAYNATQHASELDYLTELLFKAKLHAYRDELLGLLSRWSEGELPMSAPLKRVEQLIDESVLQPDVLMVSPDDERYDYHYDHDD